MKLHNRVYRTAIYIQPIINPRSHRPLRRHVLYDDLRVRWVNFGNRGPSGGESCVCLGSVMYKNLAAIPAIVGYRKIILLGRTRSHDVAKRHLTI